MDRHQATFTPAATPVPSELVAAADAVGVRVQRLYGSTEMLAATWHPADAALDRRMHSDGHPVPNVDVEIRDVSGRLCGRGETGEIYARSPGTAVGYFDDPERTAATFVTDGWIRSGDLGVFDDDGDLRVVGRVKEIVIRGGLNIAPREIEDMLVDFEEVERARGGRSARRAPGRARLCLCGAGPGLRSRHGHDGGAPPSGRPGQVQAAREAGGPRRPPHDRHRQGPKTRHRRRTPQQKLSKCLKCM